jgi:hypothetical protein
MPRTLLLIASTAIIAAIAFATPSFGGGAKGPTSIDKKSGFHARDATHRAGHLVARPSGAAASFVRGASLRYFETDAFPVAPGGRDDSFMLCPRGYKAISGYFATDGGIVADTLSSGSILRRWDFGLIDLTGLPGAAFTGIVCLKGIGA